MSIELTAEQLAQTIRPDLEMLCSSEDLTADRREALARIVEHLTPPNLLALLDERDADKKLIADSVSLFETLRQRIAELEARTVTVKLPDVEIWRSVDAVRAQNAYRVLVIKTLADAGINLTVEG